MSDPAPSTPVPPSSASAPPRRGRTVKVVALVLVVATIVADLASKAWMERRLGMDPGHPEQTTSIDVIPGIFRFQGTWNPGITFGMLPGRTEGILIFTVLACVGILVAILAMRSRSVLLHVALALILGGALGNLYDRWHWHAVRDFIVVVYWPPDGIWPAFNIADSCIVVGVILILWRELFGRRPAPGSAA